MHLIPIGKASFTYILYMAAVVVIISRHGIESKAYLRNQPDKTKLVLYKPLIVTGSEKSRL